MSEDKSKKKNTGKLTTNKELKKFLKKAVAITLVTTTLGTTAIIGGNKIHEKVYNDRVDSIVSTYGEIGEEYMLIGFLEAAKLLSQSDIDKYDMSEAVIRQFVTFPELSSPEAIIQKLAVFNEYKNASKDDLDAQYKFMQATAFLKSQAPFLYDYVRKNGYEIITRDLLSAIKEYAGEVYNVDPKKLKIYYSSISSGSKIRLEYDTRYSLNVTTGNTLGMMDDYIIFTDIKEKDLSIPLFCDICLKAMAYSEKIKEKVAEKDLYSKSAEKSLKSH